MFHIAILFKLLGAINGRGGERRGTDQRCSGFGSAAIQVGSLAVTVDGFGCGLDPVGWFFFQRNDRSTHKIS